MYVGRLAHLLMAVSLAVIAPVTASGDDLVWVWNPECGHPTKVRLRVRLDGTTLYSASLPLCRGARTLEKGKAGFRFTPSRPLIWYGYRSDEGDGRKDPGDPTPAGAALEVEFWQAGGEADAVLLGFTVVAGDGCHMNSVHLLSPIRRSATTMSPGLILETWPEKAQPRRRGTP